MVIFEMKIDLHLNIDMKKGKIYEIYGQTLKKNHISVQGYFQENSDCSYFLAFCH